jgi:hypothetical protein
MPQGGALQGVREVPSLRWTFVEFVLMPDTPSVPAERASGFGLTLVFLAYLTGFHILLSG